LEDTILRQEEEEEEIAIPPRALSPPKLKPQRPAQPNAAPMKGRSIPTKEKAKAKREYADTSYEEENVEFGRPAQQIKRLRPSPPSEGLALPGSFSAPSPLVDPPSSQLLPASDSEGDWVEVAAAEPALATPLQDDVYVEEGEEGEDLMEEIDVTAFEAEMNETLEEDEEEEEEDFLAGAVGSEPEPPPSDRPMSIGQFAGGEPSQDEDDFSSSEESDDE